MADNKSDKLSTGISGLDSLLYGGVPMTNQVLIAGGPGSGKTLLCFEMLYRIAKAGTPSLFITFEEKPDDVIKNAKAAFPDIANDIEQVIASKSMNVTSSDLPFEMSTDTERDRISSFAKINSMIEDAIKGSNAKCVTIDSLSILKLVSSDEGTLTYRRALLSMIANLRKLAVTSFITIELASTERTDIKFPTEFFIFDGIIVLYQSGSEQKRSYNLEVIKMRRSNHSLSFAPYEFTSKGFRVFTVEGSEIY